MTAKEDVLSYVESNPGCTRADIYEKLGEYAYTLIGLLRNWGDIKVDGKHLYQKGFEIPENPAGDSGDGNEAGSKHFAQEPAYPKDSGGSASEKLAHLKRKRRMSACPVLEAQPYESGFRGTSSLELPDVIERLVTNREGISEERISNLMGIAGYETGAISKAVRFLEEGKRICRNNGGFYNHSLEAGGICQEKGMPKQPGKRKYKRNTSEIKLPEKETLYRLLTEREEAVIRLYYGLKDNNLQSLDVIGKRFSIKGERVRQIKNRAIKKLHNFSQNLDLPPAGEHAGQNPDGNYPPEMAGAVSECDNVKSEQTSEEIQHNDDCGCEELCPQTAVGNPDAWFIDDYSPLLPDEFNFDHILDHHMKSCDDSSDEEENCVYEINDLLSYFDGHWKKACSIRELENYQLFGLVPDALNQGLIIETSQDNYAITTKGEMKIITPQRFPLKG